MQFRLIWAKINALASVGSWNAAQDPERKAAGTRITLSFAIASNLRLVSLVVPSRPDLVHRFEDLAISDVLCCPVIGFSADLF